MWLTISDISEGPAQRAIRAEPSPCSQPSRLSHHDRGVLDEPRHRRLDPASRCSRRRRTCADLASRLTLRTARRRRRATRSRPLVQGSLWRPGRSPSSVGSYPSTTAHPLPAPADQVSEAPSSEAHMMPALLKGVVLPEFAAHTGLEDVRHRCLWRCRGPGSESRCQNRSGMRHLAGSYEAPPTTEVSNFGSAGDFSSTEGDPEQYCRARLSEGASPAPTTCSTTGG